MDVITDPRHAIAVIHDHIAKHRAAVIEQHLVDNQGSTADTAHGFYPVVQPALRMLTDSLPEGSAWKAALEKFLDLIETEIADTNSEERVTTKKAKKQTPVK